jgi:hypothetical protein
MLHQFRCDYIVFCIKVYIFHFSCTTYMSVKTLRKRYSLVIFRVLVIMACHNFLRHQVACGIIVKLVLYVSIHEKF